jgi:S1-C subfamily serine protease
MADDSERREANRPDVHGTDPERDRLSASETPRLSDSAYDRLLGRARRTFGDLPVDKAVAKVRAIIGVPSVPDSEQAAQSALEKLRKGTQRPTANELAALEFVIRMMRPAPLSLHGDLQPLPSRPGESTYQPEVSQAWEMFRQHVKPLLYSIGRLDRTSGPNRETGTGFLVSDDLVVTNHHVVSQLSHGTDMLEPGMAVIRFYQEFEGPADPLPLCEVLGVAALHPTLDIALLRVKLSESRPPLRLEAGTAADHVPVGVIGYPYKDSRNPLFTDAIYQSRYGVKRGALGELIGGNTQLLHHDCSTLGGNSGSPVFSLETGRVVALHFSGTFMYRNEGVRSGEVAAFLHSAANIH